MFYPSTPLAVQHDSQELSTNEAGKHHETSGSHPQNVRKISCNANMQIVADFAQRLIIVYSHCTMWFVSLMQSGTAL